MWSDDEIADYEAGTGVCETCGERDILDALTTVYVAIPGWHCSGRYVHDCCRDLFVRDNLEAVLGSLRLEAR